MTRAAEALRYFAPSPPLAPFVNVLFLWTGAPGTTADWMPAIEGQIAIRLRGTGRFRFADGREVAPAPVALIGPLSSSIHMTVENMRSVGAGLTALGWQALTGMPAVIASDTILDLADLWGDGATALLHESLVAETGDTATIARLDSALVARIMTSAYRVDPRGAAVDRWIAARGDLSIDSLADALSLSPRQVARLTMATHGVSPKLLAMKHRALRAATHLALTRPHRIAQATLGYADQSHMIRDFHRFIGATPKAFLAREAARHVFEGPEDAGAHLSHGRFYETEQAR